MNAPDRILYLDLVGGIAGDMFLAALIDLGASLDRVRLAVAALGLDRVRIEERFVTPASLRARQIDVVVGDLLADSASAHEQAREHADDPDHHRRYVDIAQLLESAPDLSDSARRTALRAFRRLAEAEAVAHGVSIEEVHFHEVGADDAITDIVGVATALEDLGVHEVIVSPVPLGRGLVQGGHGPIPIPGPATLHLLRGAILAETPIEGETVTPTGAALLAAIADAYGPVPAMKLERVGVGAGHKEWPDRPNVVRALLGRRAELHGQRSREDCVIEANIDDMNPEHFQSLERHLFEAGAVDVWRTPIMMKKGRHALTVSALAPTRNREIVTSTFMLHSTTLGVRTSYVARYLAPRRIEPVETELGTVRVKISERADGPALVMPEYDDCERLAEEHGVSVRTVFEAALRAIWASSAVDTSDLPNPDPGASGD